MANDGASLLKEHATSWIESRKKPVLDNIASIKARKGELERKIIHLKERAKAFQMSSSAQTDKIEAEISGTAQEMAALDNGLAEANVSLGAINPATYLRSDELMQQMRAWDALGHADASAQARACIRTLSLADEVKDLIGQYVEIPAEIPSFNDWLEQKAAPYMPEDVLAKARGVLAEAKLSCDGLPRGILQEMSLEQLLQDAGNAEAIARQLPASIIEKGKRIAPSEVKDAENAMEAVYVLKEPSRLQHRFFGEIDLLVSKVGQYAGISPLLGMRLGSRLSLGVGAYSLKPQMADSQVSGRMLARLGIYRDVLSFDFENVAPIAGGVDFRQAAQRVGGRLSLPIGKDNMPMVFSLMKTVSNENALPAFMKQWQMGLGLSF